MAVGEGKRALLSACLFVAFCFAGGAIMMFIERHAEARGEIRKFKNYTRGPHESDDLLALHAKQFIVGNLSVNMNLSNVRQLLKAISDYKQNKKAADAGSGEGDFSTTDISWRSFQKWRYFAAVTMSTIGYGDITPRTHFGKCFVFIIAILGIPVYIYMVMSAAGFLPSRIISLKGRFQDAKVCGDVISILMCAFIAVIYIIVMGLSIASLEGWDGLSGLYWALVSVSTIGYGDLIPNSVIKLSAELVVWLSTLGLVLVVMTCQVFLNARSSKIVNKKKQMAGSALMTSIKASSVSL